MEAPATGPQKELVCWGLIDGPGAGIPIMTWKPGAKEGETWKSAFGEDGRYEATVTYLKKEKLAVPAGEYENAIHLQAAWTEKRGKAEKQVVVDVWLVPGIGIAKAANALEQGAILELKEFRPARK